MGPTNSETKEIQALDERIYLKKLTGSKELKEIRAERQRNQTKIEKPWHGGQPFNLSWVLLIAALVFR